MKEYYSLSGFGREAFSLWCGPCENCFFVNWETKNLMGGGGGVEKFRGKEGSQHYPSPTPDPQLQLELFHDRLLP